MPSYEVTFSESRELTYLVEADSEDEALEKAGELWCEDAEPYKDSGASIDPTDIEEVPDSA